MRELLRIYRREAGAYFASPVAYLFVGVFLAVTLFVFFWVETFFARNIADVRPLFEWMPILLIALVAALTMRSWSEERRAGTLEVLFTAPVSSLALVGGKFLAAITLVGLALLLTLPLPLTVAYLGPLDWGPVVGGYVAALFLGAAYVAMGLFVSARTDNPIVALLVTALVGGAFYVIGADWLTALAPAPLAGAMQWLGTGARFDEITRGVLDVRDVYYYVSLIAVFLALNVYSLEKLRWGGEHAGARRHAAWRTAVALVAVNFLLANAWLQPIAAARADITADERYSLSDATHTRLANLEEPLVIRGYFSNNTHPLLKPLVPQMRDLLREYDIAGGDKVRVRTVDPQSDSEAAQRAGEQYGIEPVSMRTASRYESSVVSAYFHVLVQYGGERTVLDFRDLVEIQRGSGSELSVSLQNPEYELTRTVRKLAHQYRSGGDVLAGLEQPVTVNAYVSPSEQLPEQLRSLRGALRKQLEEIKSSAPDKLNVQVRDPMAGDGKLAERLRSEHGIRPMAASLMSDRRFYFHILLEQGGQTVPVQLPESLEASALRDAIESGLQNFGGGFLKTVAVYQPQQPQGRGQRRRRSTGPQYSRLMDALRANASVTRTDLANGRVPSGADMLLVLAPQSLDEKQRFAIDQFLMRGGTVMVAASPTQVTVDPRQGLKVQQKETGLESWLGNYGVDIGSELVMDPQSGSLALPTRAPGGGVRTRTVDYPYFIDVRGEGLADVPMLGELNQVTMAWSSALRIDEQKAGDLSVTPLLQSSARAWTSDAQNVAPDYERYPELGFPRPDERGRQTLAAMVEGRFTSTFQGQDSPLAGASESGGGSGDGGAGEIELPERFQNLPEDAKAEVRKQWRERMGEQGGQSSEEDSQPTVTSVIEQSPPNARLIVVGSPAFATDSALQIVRRSTGTDYAAPLRLTQNLADWSLEDPSLLAMRGGGQSSRLLRPVPEGTRVTLEAANYGLAALGLGLIFVVQRSTATRRRRWYETVLNEEEG